jgi:integrase
MKQKKLPAGLRLRGDTLWLDISHQGVRYRESSGTSDVKQAEQALMRLKLALADGTHSGLTKSKETAYSVATAFDRAIAGVWLMDAAESTRRNARTHLTQLATDGYLPFSTPVARVDRHMLETIQRGLVDSGLSNSTVNSRMWVIKACLDQAERDGIIQSLPKMPKPMSVAGNARERFLSLDDEAKLLAYLEQTGKTDLMDAWMIILDTGLRLMECCRISDRMYSAERQTVTIPAEWSKSGKARVVPLTTRAMAVIERRLAGRTEAFPVPEGYRANYWAKRFDKDWGVARVALDMTDVVMHSGRHTVATRLFEVGSDLRTVMDWMGHSKPEMTLRYAKGTGSAAKTAVDRLEAFASGNKSVK